jgi:HEAT repeat protein
MKRLAFLAMLVAVPLNAQLPRITNGAVTTARAAGDLRRQIESLPNGWAGYELATNGEHRMFCSYDESVSTTNDLHVASARIAVFYRVDGHHIDRVRLRSAACDLDADGRSVTWLDGVDSRASLDLLQALVRQNDDDAKHALVALAISSGSADRLIDIARHDPSSNLRGKALFWVGQQAGEKAAAALRDAVQNDPDDGVKAKAVFGIYNLPGDQSVPLLIDLMKNHRSRAVRKKAAFWLSQKNDPRALAAFEDILTH